MGSRSTEVGRTGARFGSGGGHGSPTEDTDPGQPDRDSEEPAGSDTGVGLTGARFGPHSTRRRDKQARPPAGDPPTHDEIGTGHRPAPQAGGPVNRPTPPAEPLPLESDVLIRPYARTRGRTRPAHDLAIEALISTSPDIARYVGRHRPWEHRMIANLCVQPHSVAEVAALLSIPLGVARILLGDMASDGSIVVHGATSGRAPDLAMMRRVLAGLHRLD